MDLATVLGSGGLAAVVSAGTSWTTVRLNRQQWQHQISEPTRQRKANIIRQAAARLSSLTHKLYDNLEISFDDVTENNNEVFALYLQVSAVVAKDPAELRKAREAVGAYRSAIAQRYFVKNARLEAIAQLVKASRELSDRLADLGA